MSYHFRFERVLRARRAREHAALREVHRANAVLADAIARRDNAARAYARPPQATETIAEEIAQRVVRELSADELERHQRATNLAAADAALAQLDWNQSRQGVAVLEHLDARLRDRYREEEERKSTATIDDIVAARYAGERLKAGPTP